MEGIPEYIDALEDGKKQSKRLGNPITADTLLLIASNAMLALEWFPRADEIWEDFTKNKKDWAAWKKMYKAVAVHNQFGAAHGKHRQAPQIPHLQTTCLGWLPTWTNTLTLCP